MESMTASLPGTWDNCKASTMVEDFHTVRFDVEKSDTKPGTQIGVPLSTRDNPRADAFKEYSVFGNGGEGSYLRLGLISFALTLNFASGRTLGVVGGNEKLFYLIYWLFRLSLLMF